MVRNVYGLPTETQDSGEAGLLTQGYVFPVGKHYASTIEVCDADRVLYHREILFGTAEEARIDLTARLRVTEGITREGVQSLLYAEDDYRGTFRQAEHRTAERYDYEWVATEVVKKFREYDRVAQPNLSKQEWAELREAIQRDGFNQPVTITYFKNTRRALLTEGNHRLAIAEELGIPAIPVRVSRYAVDYVGNRGIEVPGIEGNRNGYVPADLLPSQIGIPTVPGPARTAATILEHYSRMPNLREVRPEFYGSGIAGAEKRRMRNDPDTWVDRAYFYEMGSTPESDLQGAFQYFAHLPPDARIYDLGQDPDNLKARSLNPAGGVDLNLLERNVKDAGYFGFKNSASSMPYAVGVFYALPVSKEQEVASDQGNVFDTHEPVSIGDFRPQNRYLGEMAMIERFVKEAGSTEEYLQSLGAAPEVIQFIMTQPTDLAKRLVNETRKNPQITTQQMEDFVAKFSGQPKYEPTYRESIEADRFQEVPGMPAWVLLQLKKHRGRKVDRAAIGLESAKFPRYEFEYTWPPEAIRGAAAAWSISAVDATFQQIRDWARATGAQIASYDFSSAIAESDKWHEEQAEQGAGGGYEEKNVVHTFENGWTIQLVKSKNDLEVEGNHMGHCVGSYCSLVANYNTIIYSLRDPKNQPHVTIEVKGDIDREPDDNEMYPYYAEHRPESSGPTNHEWEIVQIQGRGNKEPIDQYKAMIKEWFSTIKGKLSRDDGNQNLDDAIYNHGEDLHYIEELLDNYTAGGETDEYGIPTNYYVHDPTDFVERTMTMLEKQLGRRGFYRNRDGLAESLADAAFKADTEYFSQPRLSWPNRSILDVQKDHEDVPVSSPEYIQKYTRSKARYSAIQHMYDRNDKYFENFRDSVSENMYGGWLRENPEPDREDFGSDREYEKAYGKWEDGWHKEEEDTLDDAYQEDDLGGFYMTFFERLQDNIKKSKMGGSPYETWASEQLKFVNQGPLSRKGL